MRLSLSNLSRLHQEIEDYVRYLAPCDQEERLRLHVIGCIREVVDSLWPRASLRVFGSFATKLYVTTRFSLASITNERLLTAANSQVMSTWS